MCVVSMHESFVRSPVAAACSQRCLPLTLLAFPPSLEAALSAVKYWQHVFRAFFGMGSSEDDVI